MPDPVFGAEDRVDQQVELPPELVAKLQGKSAAEQTKLIVQHYQTREKDVIKTAREAIRTNDPTKLPNGEPARREEPVRRVTTERTELNPNELDNARQTLIATAIDKAKAGKKYWDRFEGDIMKMMEQMEPQFRVNYQYYETCYYNLVGANKDKLDTEEREAAATATRLAAERASSGSTQDEPPAPLNPLVVTKVLPGLGISEKQYREGDANINAGKWPLTFDKAGR